MTLAIGVDIGGTKIAAGLVSEAGEILDSAGRADPRRRGPDPRRSSPTSSTGSRARRRPPASASGRRDSSARTVSTVRFAPNIDWREEPLGQRVRALVDLPVVVENDANAAAWGEFRFGAGEDTDDLLLITVGTGIGGGIVHRGQLFRGGFGVAAEIGHMRIVPDGMLCGCGQHGCFEQYGSGSALVRDARERVANGDPAPRPSLRWRDGDRPITGPGLTQLAQDGDPLAVELLADLGRWLGEGAAVLATILDPSVIAIGGGVAAAGDLFLDTVVDAFETHLPARAHRPQAALRLAALGNEAGIIGAADLARTEPL